jgi:hypothetical protein
MDVMTKCYVDGAICNAPVHLKDSDVSDQNIFGHLDDLGNGSALIRPFQFDSLNLIGK